MKFLKFTLEALRELPPSVTVIHPSATLKMPRMIKNRLNMFFHRDAVKERAFTEPVGATRLAPTGGPTAAESRRLKTPEAFEFELAELERAFADETTSRQLTEDGNLALDAMVLSAP